MIICPFYEEISNDRSFEYQFERGKKEVKICQNKMMATIFYEIARYIIISYVDRNKKWRMINNKNCKSEFDGYLTLFGKF